MGETAREQGGSARRRTHRAARGLLAAAAVTLVGGVLAAGVGPGTGGADPPGNNGTVKIDGSPISGGQSNVPHVGCTFTVEFFGYDEGAFNAAVSFTGVAPTGGGALLSDSVFIGEDAAGGGTDADAAKVYDLSGPLSGIAPHPQQGHHVKLTVNAPGSQGADVKHKTFWVSGCAAPPTTTTTEPATTTTAPATTTTTPAGATTTTAAAATTTTTVAVAGIVVAPQAAAPQPQGVEAEQARALPSELAFTGSEPVWPLAALGILLLVVGGMVIPRYRERVSVPVRRR